MFIALQVLENHIENVIISEFLLGILISKQMVPDILLSFQIRIKTWILLKL